MSSPRLTAFGTLTNGLRRHLSVPPSEEAVAAIEELLPEGPEFTAYLSRFTVLIVLSTGIAAFGLLADSAGVVIGAMLVAPLMTPITAAAAATVMARNRRLVRSLVVIAFGVVGAVAIGWLIAFITGVDYPNASDLPKEISARTYPGLLDLGIAVTAGAAAGYILPRRSVTSALPGVGIAVALVPPLATVGICMRAATGTQASNAFLLFLTNLAAIVFAASIALILSGFRPEKDVPGTSLLRRVLVTFVGVAIVAIPLTIHTRSTIRDASLRRSVASAVTEWDDSVRVLDMLVTVEGGVADVELLVSGPSQPRPAWKLASAISDRFDGPVDLTLTYQLGTQFSVSVR